MPNCVLKEVNGIQQCVYCDTLYWTRTPIEVECPVAKEGLGDYTERVLKSMGITESRYKEIKAKFGLSPRCNCKGRKQWLNKVSAYIRSVK